MSLHRCSKLASSVYLTVEALVIYAKMMMNSQMLPFLWQKWHKKKLNSMKPKADKELNVYGTMQEVTLRLKLEWNLKMRYNSQIRKWIYQLWQVIICLLRWQIHEKMAISRLKSNFTNIALLCTWMPVELNFVIFFVNIFRHNSFF